MRRSINSVADVEVYLQRFSSGGPRDAVSAEVERKAFRGFEWLQRLDESYKA